MGNGKQSIGLDLKNKNAVTIIKKLCQKSDVVLEPYRPGVMEKLGLGPKELMSENEKLIYARLTGFGQEGYFAKRAGHDINYLAISGLLSLFGRSHEKPIFPTNLAADFGGGGLMCAIGILLALFERTKSGKGQVIDANMVEGTSYLGSWLYRSQTMPIIWGQERGKNILDTGAHFYEVYETKDHKFMAVGALEPQFYANLLDCLNLDFEAAPQFENFDHGKQLFQKKFLEKTQEEWCRIFDNVDACVTPVLSLNDAPNHPHNSQKQSFKRFEDTFVPKPAPNLQRTPGKSVGTEKLPEVGQNTREILKELNYSESEISHLEDEGAIEICHISSKL